MGVLHPQDLRWPFLVDGIVMAAGAGFYFLLWWFSRPMQQKVSILSMFGALCSSLAAFVLYANEGNWDRTDGARSFWLFWLGLAGSFGFVSATHGQFLIMHNWAKEIQIGSGVALPLFAVAISLSASNLAQLILIIFGVAAFLWMAYLLLLNVTRRDWLGYIMVFVNLAGIVFFGIVLLLGPEFLGSQLASLDGFTYQLYFWLLFALAVVYVLVVPLVAWFFIEDEITYRMRKGLPSHEHLSTGDGTAIALLPSAVNGAV